MSVTMAEVASYGIIKCTIFMFLNILFILFYFVCRPLSFELRNTEHLQLIAFDTTDESLIAFNFASQVEASRFREKNSRKFR
jgi:hypothetical protein